MKLEVVVLPVSDVDQARDFYQRLGWRLDANFARGDFRVGCYVIYVVREQAGEELPA